MRLSTSTNILHKFGNEPFFSMKDCLRRCKAAGFHVLDINFCDMTFPGQPLTKPDWETWVETVKEDSQREGLVFSQSHAPFYNVCNEKTEHREFLEEMVRRSIIASGMLGVNWITMHAGTVQENGYSAQSSLKANQEYFKPCLELAKKYSSGIALENMADFAEHRRWYTAATEELITLADSFDDDSVGICWDFGHANLTKTDQVTSLKAIGKRLRSTHVDDNHGHTDEHLAPFYGNIEWEAVMKALSEIEYAGDFTFEIHEFVRNVPEKLRDSQLAYAFQIGEYLLNLI